MIDRPTINNALHSLCPGGQWTLRGGEIIWTEVLDDNNQPTGEYIASNLEWHSNNISIPAKSQLEAELARLQAEYDATEYQRLRQPAYPPLSDLADALYWQSKGDESKMTAYLAQVAAIKNKYPKGTQ